MYCLSCTLFLTLVFHKSLSLNNFDAARRVNLINCNQQVSSIKCRHWDWFALDNINQAHRMSIEETVFILAFELARIRSSSRRYHFKLDIEICWLVLCRLIAESFKLQCLWFWHSWFHEDVDKCRFCLNRASIESDDLSPVRDLFLGSIEEFIQWSLNSNVDIIWFGWSWLPHSSECSSEEASFDLAVCTSNISQICAQVEERILFQEEFIENLIAVLLILVTASEDTIRSFNSSSKTFSSITLIHRSSLLIREHFVRLTDRMELR